MTKIIRTPNKAHGGITPEEKSRMDDHAKLWIARAMRTDPIEPDKIIPAIEGIYAAAGLKKPRVVIVPSPLVMALGYAAAGLKKPRVVIVPSPLVMAFGYGAAAAIRYNRGATYSATDSATDEAVKVCFGLAGDLGLQCADRWSNVYQGGNMWAAWDCYLTAARDILGLRLTSYDAYSAWEKAAIHGGFWVMHPEVCIVCDFPEILLVDDQNRPHCVDGPSHRWRDGWSLYHWHGVRVPDAWIADRANLTARDVMAERNVEVRRAGIEMLGWARIVDDLGGRVIEADPDPEVGSVIELTLPDLDSPQRFIRVRCATGRDFALCLPPDFAGSKGYSLPHCAQAFMAGLTPAEWRKPTLTA